MEQECKHLLLLAKELIQDANDLIYREYYSGDEHDLTDCNWFNRAKELSEQIKQLTKEQNT